MTIGGSEMMSWSSDRLELGEGGRWIDGRLYIVDQLSGRLLVAAGRGQRLSEVLKTETPLGAVAARRGHVGSWIVAASTGIALVDRSGRTEWLGRPEAHHRASVVMNDGAVDTAGRFWASSMAGDGTVGAGALYRVDHDRRIVRVVDGLSIGNGPAFSPDGQVMFLADSALGVIYRFQFEAETGTPRERETFVRFGPEFGVPDGMTVDAEGALWVAMWGGGAIRRYRSDGTLDQIVAVPARQPTSVCFGGADERELFVTSAAVGLSDPGDADGAVFMVPVVVGGPPATSAVLL